MASITEFLEARIAEDVARAEACTTGRYDLTWCMEGTTVYPLYQMTDGSPNEGNWIPEEHADFITTNAPARILAECAAKRAIVGLAQKASEAEKEFDDYEWQGTVESSEPLTGDAILYTLAAVYADHPDYRQEWAPRG